MTFEIQAHRGARAFYPENTVPAFCKAADLGCPVVELDLVVSSDRQIVVAHDPWLDLPGIGRRQLYAMPYAEIAGFDCGEVSPAFPAQKRINACRPLLSEVFRDVERHLDAIGRPGGMVYNLEVKSWPERDGTAHPVPEAYAALVVGEIMASGLSGRVRLQSFDSRILEESKRLVPGLSYGLLVEEPVVFERFPEMPGFVPEYVNPKASLVDEALVRWLHGFGVKVVPWTVNDPEEMLAMKQFGADGIITDHPERALHLPGLVTP